MSISKIEIWINSLGRSYEDLLAQEIIPDQPLLELFSGIDRLYLEVETGISLSFWAETERFEELYITLKKTTPSTVEYKGELPKPYSLEMSQSSVHAIFGEPYKSQAPIKMPQPMGQAGGWESYRLDSVMFPGIEVVFQYTAEMQVDTLVFALVDVELE